MITFHQHHACHRRRDLHALCLAILPWSCSHHTLMQMTHHSWLGHTAGLDLWEEPANRKIDILITVIHFFLPFEVTAVLLHILLMDKCQLFIVCWFHLTSNTYKQHIKELN